VRQQPPALVQAERAGAAGECYSAMSAIYEATKVVVDDANTATVSWGGVDRYVRACERAQKASCGGGDRGERSEHSRRTSAMCGERKETCGSDRGERSELLPDVMREEGRVLARSANNFCGRSGQALGLEGTRAKREERRTDCCFPSAAEADRISGWRGRERSERKEEGTESRAVGGTPPEPPLQPEKVAHVPGCTGARLAALVLGGTGARLLGCSAARVLGRPD